MALAVDGILRKCGRCREWLTIDDYDGLAKVCRWCMFSNAPKIIGPSISRGIVITESGRELLRELRAEENAA